jgi:hypothetical protein
MGPAVEGRTDADGDVPDDRMTRRILTLVMRGARLIITYRDPSTGNGAKAVVRSRLAAVCEIQIACELQRSERASERLVGKFLRVPTLVWLREFSLEHQSRVECCSEDNFSIGGLRYKPSLLHVRCSFQSGKVVARRKICSRRSRMLPEGGREVYSFGMTAVIVTQHL